MSVSGLSTEEPDDDDIEVITMACRISLTDRGEADAASSDTVNERVGVVNPDGDDDDIEVLLVDVVEAWEMETCTCRAAGRMSRPLLRVILCWQ